MTPRAPWTFRRDAGLGRLDGYHAPAAEYFVASTGDRWRIRDCRMVEGRLRPFPTVGAAAAQFRVFVAETGVRKVYTRTAGEIWRLAGAQLAQQLAAAEFLGQTPEFNDTDRSAT